MGLRPDFISPRTLVRTWGTRTELREWKSGLAGHLENISRVDLGNRSRLEGSSAHPVMVAGIELEDTLVQDGAEIPAVAALGYPGY